MEHIITSAALSPLVSIAKLIEYTMTELDRVVKGTKHESDWYFYHDALSLMIAVDMQK